MKKKKKHRYIKILTIILTISTLIICRNRNNIKKDIFIPVLMYHNIDPDPEFKKITYTMRPELFEKHMKALRNKGYNTITTTQLDDYHYKKIELPEKPILVTFDDGKTNNYTYAYPVLKKLKMKANIFIIGHTAQEHNNDEYLKWDKLKEMYDNQVMDIQSHTYNLHHKTNDIAVVFREKSQENDIEYQQRIINDFKKSKQLIEENIGNKVNSLAYPYGEYDEKVEQLAKEAGYMQTYTTDVGIMKKTDSPYLIKRINVDGLCSERRLLTEIKVLSMF